MMFLSYLTCGENPSNRLAKWMQNTGFVARGHGFDISNCYIDRSILILKVLFCQLQLRH